MREYANPIGVHQIHRWTRDDLSKLHAWCPEYRLCEGDFGWEAFRETEVEKEEMKDREQAAKKQEAEANKKITQS